MLRKTLPALLLLALLLSAGLSLAPRSISQANAVIQEERPLQGRRIYLGAANGEVSLFDRNENGASRLAALLLRQGAELFLLNWDVPVPNDASLVILAAPTTDYSGAQMAHLWTYVSRGGNLLVLLEPGRAIRPESALMELLWDGFGIQMRPGMLLNAAYLVADLNNPPTSFVTNLVLPPNLEPPIVGDLQTSQIVMTSACPLQTDSVIANTTVSPLLVTADQYYSEANLQAVASNAVQFDIATDLAPGPQTVMAAALNNTTQARVAVICDADMIMNKSGFMTSPPGSDRFVFPESVRLMFNAIYWSLEAEGSPNFTFQPPAPTATPTLTPSATPTFTPTPQGF